MKVHSNTQRACTQFLSTGNIKNTVEINTYAQLRYSYEREKKTATTTTGEAAEATTTASYFDSTSRIVGTSQDESMKSRILFPHFALRRTKNMRIYRLHSNCHSFLFLLLWASQVNWNERKTDIVREYNLFAFVRLVKPSMKQTPCCELYSYMNRVYNLFVFVLWAFELKSIYKLSENSTGLCKNSNDNVNKLQKVCCSNLISNIDRSARIVIFRKCFFAHLDGRWARRRKIAMRVEHILDISRCYSCCHRRSWFLLLVILFECSFTHSLS